MRSIKKMFVAMTSAALLASLAIPAGAAAPVADGVGRAGSNTVSDNLPNPLAERQAELKRQAQAAVLQGKAKPTGQNKVVQQGKGQFVELAQTGEDLIWTVLGEFGDADSPFGSLKSGQPGPQHNEIPEPNRKVDNSTIWTPDFSREYYETTLFSRAAGAVSMATYYLEQSSGAYSVDGEVTDWGQVPYNTAHYGRDWCGSIVCSTTWWFVEDSLNAWWDSQISAGKTPAELNDYLSQYDVWDRYDWDGDGNFDEPDGYIDHFQSVHAGEGQETGGGAFGSDSIWSHRWYVQLTGIGDGGPMVGGVEVPFGGVQVGGSQYWVGDYTIEPENGGVGVFAHEFAHDLGLPDLYDTAGNTGGGENSTGFWTLMSSGSYGNNGTVDIGSKPTHMGAWEKFQLGWLDYGAALYNQSGRVKLGTSMHQTSGGAQGFFVVLPDKEVQTQLADPYAGSNFYYSGSGANLDNVMYKAVTLPGGASVSAQVNFDIELDWDYAYLVVSTDGGATWNEVETTQSTTDDPNGQNFGFGITGDSNGWVPLTADLSAYTGDVLVGFRYWTDGFVNDPGFMVDEIMIAGEGPFGAETDDGFVFDPADGFSVTTGLETTFHFNAYVVEFRQYRGYDESLKDGPYNFGFLNNPDLGNYVEHFQYMEGLLISYWDESFDDNNTGANCDAGRCGGLILPIDSHPTPLMTATGGYWRSRVQSFDSPFGLTRTKKTTLHLNSQASTFPSLPGNPVFDDTKSYWNAAIPWSSVQVPGIGVTIRAGSAHGSYQWMYLNQ